jgi:hypothetical protein
MSSVLPTERKLAGKLRDLMVMKLRYFAEVITQKNQKYLEPFNAVFTGGVKLVAFFALLQKRRQFYGVRYNTLLGNGLLTSSV